MKKEKVEGQRDGNGNPGMWEVARDFAKNRRGWILAH